MFCTLLLWHFCYYDAIVTMALLLQHWYYHGIVAMMLLLPWQSCYHDTLIAVIILTLQSLWFCHYYDTSVLPGWEGPVTMILSLLWHFCVARLRRTCHCDSVVTMTLLCCQVEKDLSLWFCYYRDTSVLPGWKGPVTVILLLPWHFCVARLKRTYHCDSVVTVTFLCCQVEKDLSLWFCCYCDTSVLPGWKGPITVILLLLWHFCVARLRRTYQTWVLVRHQCLN